MAKLGIDPFDTKGFGFVGHRRIDSGRVDALALDSEQIGVIETCLKRTINEDLNTRLSTLRN